MIHLEIADLFCGAGGTSTGAIEAAIATGHKPRLTAVNHWDRAIATHSTNHPDARHLCTGIDEIDPRKLFGPGKLDLLWASPECTHHSVARGGKPINDQSRATAFCVPRWADACRPRRILVENVPEFQTWGPVDARGKPIAGRKGEMFKAWVGMLEAIGYRVEWRVLCAADYGDPTTRRRLFVHAVLGKTKIVWPEPTHDKNPSDTLFPRKPWVPAREIIDWSVEGQSIYERKKPLSPKTMARIFAGLQKFGLKPFIIPKEGVMRGNKAQSIDKPVPTVITDGRIHLAQPFIVRTAQGNDDRTGNERRARDLDKPLDTVAASHDFALAEPFLITMEHGGSIRSIDKPIPTVTTARGGAMGLANPFLVKMRGTNDAASLDKPAPTVTATGTHLGLAEPFLIHTAHGKKRGARSVKKPLPTVTGNRGDMALVQGALLPQQGGGALRPVDQPAPTVATGGAIGLVEPFLMKYNSTGGARSVRQPVDTISCKPRYGLVRPVVIVNDEKYLLDIRFRMLQTHELAAAQGFRKDYKFTGTKTEQVKQIGNAVPRRLVRALVAASLSQSADVREYMEDAA